jgi:hypothetical protein
MKFSATVLALYVSANPCPHANLAKRGITVSAGVTAAKQLDNAWTKVISSASFSTQYTYSIPAFLFESVSPSVNYVSDELPSGRTKKLHAAGAVVKVKFQAVRNPYTGLFQGAEHALLRYSLAVAPDNKGIVVAGAIKLFRDNTPSANTFIMLGLAAQPESNFFTHDLSNHISGTRGGVLTTIGVRKFATAPSNWAPFTGVSGISDHDVRGNVIDKPVYPYQLVFRPKAGAKSIVEADLQKNSSSKDAYRSLTSLAKIPRGTTLWDVYAAPAPNTSFKLIGSVVTVSETVLNAYGNDGLFFQHQTWDKDVAPGTLGAPWALTCPKYNSCDTCHDINTCSFI